MVFESLVVELINRYLGDFVENLDTSQLKIGIWGGDVVLNNLNLKQSALDNLDLPVKIKAGHIGKLVLKIPWKNLYTEAVVAEIDGIYALAVPNAGIQYNAEKEELAKQEAKQKKLLQIEEAKKLAAMKGQPQVEKSDSFAEKMATQVIKNLQVKVSNIHVRYEDRFTNPRRPFSVGFSLQELLFQTTDDNWKPCVIKEAVTQIYKLVRLDCLSVYWNSSSPLLDGLDKAKILETLKGNISSQGNRPGYQYVVRPISAVAHLRLNTKPEQSKYTVPKIGVTVVFDDIAVGLTKDQYDDVLEMLESLERMNLLSLHRKFRPDIGLPGNSSKWWRYAYHCVMEDTVQRRRQMWSWKHIKQHRLAMKRYRDVYVKKLNSKKTPADIQRILDDNEKYLDVFCITLMRQQAEVEAAKMGARKREEAGAGWFGGWLGGGGKKKNEDDSYTKEDMQNKFYELYSSDEKAKLYSAIGYEENETDQSLPVEYIAVRIITKLRNVTVFIRDLKQKEQQLLKFQLKDVYSSFVQRPAANAILLEAKVDRMIVSGSPQADFVPKMITSQVQDKEQEFSLLTLAFETNPLDGSCDTSIKVKARPLEIVYDAVTINKLAVFFRPPESVQLKQFSQAAMAKFDEIKEQSSAGIQHAIESHKYTDINVHLMSSYVIIPEGGIMRENVKLLVLDLGQLQVTSEKHDTVTHGRETLEEKIAKAYDKLNIKLQNIQLLFVKPGDAWQVARDKGESPLHILNPISIALEVRQCIIERDPRFARMKVQGELHSIQITLSDTRIQNILALVSSVPLPESPPGEEEEDDIYKSTTDLRVKEMGTAQVLNTAVNAAMDREDANTSLLSLSSSSFEEDHKGRTAAENVNFSDMELVFEIKQVILAIRHTQNDQEMPYLNLTVNRIGTIVKLRTFDMVVDTYIGTVNLQQLEYQLSTPVINQLRSVGASADRVVNILNTPTTADPDFKLFTLKYLQAKRKGPDFHTEYNNTEQWVCVHFTALEVLLHKDSVLSLMDFAKRVTPPAGQTKPQSQPSKMDLAIPSSKKTSKVMLDYPVASDSNKTLKEPGTKRRVKPEELTIINMKVEAVLRQFSVGICNDEQLITHVQIMGIQSNVTMRKEKMEISALIGDMVIFDPDPNTLHQKILHIVGSEVLKADVAIFNDGTDGAKYADMSCVDTSVAVEIGCIKVVFVNKFVNSLLAFVDNFSAAQEKIAQAGQAAAQAGLEAVQSLQDKATRLALKVKMKAPVIIVPRSSTSLNALMLDLGLLTVSNHFQLAGSKSLAGVPAVLELMNVELNAFQLSRALVKKDGSIQAECIILEPVTFSLKMQRNLSATWYHAQPDIQLGGALEPLTLRLSEGDFATAMQVLNENLTEGGQPPAPPRTSMQIPATSKSVKESVQPLMEVTSESSFDKQVLSVNEPETLMSTSTVVSSSSSSSGDTYISIKVDFQLKGLCAYFYTGDTVLSAGRMAHAPAKALGKFELQVIAVAASIMSDKAISAKVTLMDTIIDDMRIAKQNGITRMIERSKTESHGVSSMISVDYKADGKGDQKVRLGISSLYICVCVEFLMTIANFFTKGMATKATDMAIKAGPEIATALPASAAGGGEGALPQAQGEQGSMDIVLEMDKPEIILIEDQLNFDTNALVIDMMLSFRLRQMKDEQVINAAITKMQIFSCTFSDRSSHQMQVLMPCDITLHSNSKNGKNPHMAVNLTDMVLNISPATIETMSAVSAGLAVSSDDDDTAKREMAPEGLWQVKKISDCKFWFLAQPVGSEVDVAQSEMKLNFSAIDVNEREEELDEQLILTMPSLVVKLEGGIGHRTIPLLIVESSLQAQVRNWSNQLYLEGSFDLEVGYYNERCAVWEPIIEPVIHEGKIRRWQLNLEVQKNVDIFSQADDNLVVEADEQVVALPSKMIINVTSSDILPVCVTKTCLEVLTNLGKAFNDAYNLVKKTSKKEETVFSPYVFRNQTGYEIVLKLDSSFETPPSAVQGKVKLGVGAVLPVLNKAEAVSNKTKASMIKATQEGDERKIIFQVEQFGATREVTIKRAEKRLFQINQRSHQGDIWSVICKTDCTIGQKLVTLQSILSVSNELLFPVEVFYHGDTQLEICGVVQPDSHLSLPLNAVYCLSSNIFFKPVGDRYTVSEKPVNWRTIEKDGPQQISCPTVSRGHSPCYFNVFPEAESVFFELGDEKSAKCFVMSLKPSVILHNLLPFSVKYMLEGTDEQEELKLGENRPLIHAAVDESNLEIVIPSYKGLEWVGKRKLQKNMPELTIWEFNAYESHNKVSLELGLHCKVNKASLDVSVYSPYWLLNKTGRTLYYKGSDQDTSIENKPEEGQLTLFSFAGKSFFGGKKKAQLRIADLEWSDKFSLDVVGSSGTVSCKSKVKDTTGAEVGVSIRLSSSGLTKMVTFTPFYMFLNTSIDTILVSEADRENWVALPPGQCQAYWPQITSKDISVKAKVKDTQEVTGAFLINKAHTTLMRLDNQYGGINSDCQVSESSMITTLQTFRADMATVHVINHTHNATITFYQSGEQRSLVTLPKQSVILYTWDNALGKRELVWSCGKKKDVKNDLSQDGMDEFFADDDMKVYWVSFLNGLQRVLLFTEDIAVAVNAREAGELEQVEQEINLQLHGLGLSLVDNYKQVEVSFLGVTSSGIIWEERKKRRYKALKLKDCLILENAWQKYQNELAVGKSPNHRIILENKMEVDFADMTVVRPKTFPIRRSFENGVWIQYKTSLHQMQLHAKVNRLQLDNQLSHAVFSTVLSPLPPPKSVAAESVPKPFTELSIMMQKHEHSTVAQFKYFKVLIQEMNVKVDQGFLNALLELFAPTNALPREQETIQFKQDLDSTEKTLMVVAGLSLAEEQKNFYDYLHFSPIKIHLSFSLQSGTGANDGKPTEIQAGVLNVFLQSVGVVLTDVQDVVFKLGYFERSHNFYNQSQLIGVMTRHYAGQAIKQMYVLVLGLDVLGNPFGLLRGLSEGIEDLFYEPYQGAIQGPEEFAEGLALGVRSLFGHAVGGAAGAVSRITGTLGKGLATLTLDDEYQKKRREALNKRPANAREGFARGGKGLVMGVFDGVTGIVRKPMEGAKQEGVSGFFKGVGKGLVGVVTRPTSGVVDFASSSFEGIRRIAEVNEDIKRLRPPRRFFKDKVIRPYNHQEAEGYAILSEIEKGKYSQTDEYQAHVLITADGKNVLLVTDKRILMAKRGEIFGSWDAEWMYVWVDLREDTPQITSRGFEIVLKEKEKKRFFSSGTTKKEVPIPDPKVAEWIVGKITEQIARLKN